MKMVKIYTLEDPESGDIRYVGMTTGTLKQRLSQHVYDGRNRRSHKSNWISSMLKVDKRPVIKLLEECHEDIWEDVERMYISLFKTWGFNLTNLDEGGKGSIINRKDRHVCGYLRSIEAHKKVISMYNMNGDHVRDFKSLNEATFYCTGENKKKSTITECLRGRAKTAYGYLWTYKGDVLVMPDMNYSKTRIIILTNDNEELEFSSVKRVEVFLKVGRPRVIKAIDTKTELKGYYINYKI